MSSFLRWALREMRPALRGPELQESLDLRRALNCLAARGSSSSQSGPLDDNASLSLSQKRELVHTSVMAQLLQLLRAVAETDAGESARRRRHRHHPNDGSGPDPNAFPLNTAARAGGVSEHRAQTWHRTSTRTSCSASWGLLSDRRRRAPGCRPRRVAQWARFDWISGEDRAERRSEPAYR